MTPEASVIVGASAAGVAAALGMRAAGYRGSVTLVDADPRLPYERPPLSKAFGPDGGVLLRPILPPEMYAEHAIALRLGDAVAALDLPGRRVVLAGGAELPADAVLLATGLRARRLELPGADLGGVLTLRTADDALALAGRLRTARSLVVIGGGFIGLEVAAAARLRGLRVTVVEALELPLLAPLGPEVALLLAALHTEHGVRIIAGATAVAFDGAQAVTGVHLTTGERLPADLVVVGCGVLPNDGLALSAGIACDDGIPVDAYGRTSAPGVWAAGDVAAAPHPALATPGRIEHWDTAQHSGAAVGRSMAGVPTENVAVPYFWSEQYDRMLQVFGRARPGDTVVLRAGASPHRFLVGWLRNDIVVAAAGVGYPRDLRQVKTLIERRAAIPAEALRDPATDFRRLSKALPVS